MPDRTAEAAATVKHDMFDHVIIGAGAAGCVLAARLSDDRSRRVLLIEQGAHGGSLLTRMPGAVGAAIASGRNSATLEVNPAGDLDSRRLAQIQGRGLGGSSLINGMMYVRGHRADYDGWAAAGCAGWSHDDVLPYFRKSEAHASRRDAFHGTRGPVAVRTAPFEGLSPVHNALIEAGVQAGFGRTGDFNGIRQEGFGLFDQTIGKGARSDAASSFLPQERANLVIRTGSRALAIAIEDGKAVGVRIADREGETFVAGREIILCAGAYASPHLLMLSGIGPAVELRSFGIPVVRDLPGVGGNLQNHADVVLQFRLDRPLSLLRETGSLRKALAGARWLLTRRGPGATNHFEAGAFLRSDEAQSRPNLQLTLLNLALRPGSMEPRPEEAFQLHVTLVRPRSRGTVRLGSPSSNAAPVIDLRYLAEPADRVALRHGIRIARTVVRQEAMAGLCGGELLPGDLVTSDEALDRWIGDNIATFYHPAGTCRMGAADDPGAVVSPDLAVRGIDRLRVADASVMPILPAGNSYAPTMMIAEKAADIIRAASQVA